MLNMVTKKYYMLMLKFIKKKNEHVGVHDAATK